jgi:hypothetical protein
MGAEETATGTLAAVAADQVGRAADLLAGDREDLGVGPAPGLGLGPAGERLQGPVHGRDPPERVGQQHPVGDGVEHRPGLAGRPLRLLQAQGRLHGAGDLVAGQPQQGLLLAVQPVALGPAQGEQAEEPAPGQQRDQGQGADPQPGHQVLQDRGPAGHLVQVGHAHDLAGAQALQGQDLADLDVGLDDVVGHAGVGEPGPGPQVKVADGAGGPQEGPGRPDLGLEAGQGHLGQPLEAGRPDDLGRQVPKALQGLHAAGQASPHRLQVAGHRAQLVLDPRVTGVSRSPPASRPEAARRASAGAPTARRSQTAISTRAASIIRAVRTPGPGRRRRYGPGRRR